MATPIADLDRASQRLHRRSHRAAHVGDVVAAARSAGPARPTEASSACSFPDWEDWPQTLASARFDISYNGEHRVDPGDDAGGVRIASTRASASPIRQCGRRCSTRRPASRASSTPTCHRRCCSRTTPCHGGDDRELVSRSRARSDRSNAARDRADRDRALARVHRRGARAGRVVSQSGHGASRSSLAIRCASARFADGERHARPLSALSHAAGGERREAGGAHATTHASRPAGASTAGRICPSAKTSRRRSTSIRSSQRWDRTRRFSGASAWSSISCSRPAASRRPPRRIFP